MSIGRVRMVIDAPHPLLPDGFVLLSRLHFTYYSRKLPLYKDKTLKSLRLNKIGIIWLMLRRVA